MIVSFDDPQVLWLAAIALPLGLLGLFWFRAMIPMRRVTAVVLRALLFILIAGALAGTRKVQESKILATVAVIDLSESTRLFGSTQTSIEETVRTFLQASTRNREADDLLGVVVFDRNAIAIGTPSRADVLSRPFGSLGLDGSNIESALRLAGGLVPPDATGRIVLFSDGNQTVGQADAAAAAIGNMARGLNTSGMAIDVVPITYNIDREVVVESLDAPPRAASESTITVRVVLRSTTATSGTLQLLREGSPIRINETAGTASGRRIALNPGRNVELVQLVLEPGPVHRFEAVFVPDQVDDAFVGDAVLANNRATAFTLTPGRGSVLIVDGVSNGSLTATGATLARVLIDAGMEVQTVAPAGFPTQMLDLQRYDLIMLQNVPAESLDDQQQDMLVAQVRDLGTGLVMIGGPDSFGAGGWHGSRVADVLPVRLDLPDRIIVPEAAIVFVLDNSGSMAASVLGSVRSQQQIANEAAAMAVQSLDRTDLVGVISFNESHRVVKELSLNTDPDQTASRIRSIASGGGTTLGPALRVAAQQLANADAKLKQVIVLSDGRSSDAEILEQVAATMAAQDIRVTAIGIGDAADSGSLAAVARAGGGSFYSVINPNLLPRIFLKAVRIVRSPLVREQIEPVRIDALESPFVAGFESMPPVHGLVLTRERDEPGIINALRTQNGEPLLAHWNIGLGQVVAFTSDAHAWASPWLDTTIYRAFWLQLARTASRVRQETNSELMVVESSGVLHMKFNALDKSNRPLDLLDVPVSVFGPSGQIQELDLLQVGPGQYESTINAPDAGPYIVVAKPMRQNTRLPPLLAGATTGASTELARLEPNTALLNAIASYGDGRVLDINQPDPTLMFDRSTVRPHRTSSPLWPALIAWAVVVFLLDVGTRRVAWDRFISRQFGASIADDLRRATAQNQPQSIAELMAARRTGNTPDSTDKLNEQDAKRVAAEAKRARWSAQSTPAPSVVQSSPASQPSKSVESADQDESKEESSLMAAKRRARERFEENHDA